MNIRYPLYEGVYRILTVFNTNAIITERKMFYLCSALINKGVLQ